MPKVKPQPVPLNDIYSTIAAPSQGRHRGQVGRAMRDMGEVIYGVRTFDELIKIGWTANLAERLGGFGINRSQLHRLLFIVPGTREEEKVIHSLLTEHIARGREHYHPSAEVIELVNLMRANYDLPPMAA